MSKEREQLVARITEAVDGSLGKRELRELREQLKQHPDLYEEYMKQYAMPDWSSRYRAIRPAPGAVQRLRSRLHRQPEELVIAFFLRYVCSPALVLMVVLSGLQFIGWGPVSAMQNGATDEYFEFFYGEEASFVELSAFELPEGDLEEDSDQQNP